MSIKLIDRSPLKLEFTNKLMTAYGGFSLLSRLFDRLDLEAEVQAMMPFVETSPNGTGVYAKILKFGLTVPPADIVSHTPLFLGTQLRFMKRLSLSQKFQNRLQR
jgi:hypothetical protein